MFAQLLLHPHIEAEILVMIGTVVGILSGIGVGVYLTKIALDKVK